MENVFPLYFFREGIIKNLRNAETIFERDDTTMMQACFKMILYRKDLLVNENMRVAKRRKERGII